MSIYEKFYSLNSIDIDKVDFFKNLSILSQEGFLVFVNPSYHLKKNLEPFFVENILSCKELEKYQINTSDTIVTLKYKQNLENIFSKINRIDFEYFFFVLENGEYAISWVEAGKYTTVYLSLELIDDNKMRMFSESLYINNYCTQLFSYKKEYAQKRLTL